MLSALTHGPFTFSEVFPDLLLDLFVVRVLFGDLLGVDLQVIEDLLLTLGDLVSSLEVAELQQLLLVLRQRGLLLPAVRVVVKADTEDGLPELRVHRLVQLDALQEGAPLLKEL